ncbi:MAG: serine hydrolase [Bacteroidota bacterium]
MSRLLFYIVTLLLFSSMAVGSAWSWNSWLPQFLQPGWTGEQAVLSPETRQKLASSEAGRALLAFPSADSVNTNMEWPISGLNPDRWHAAKTSAQLIHDYSLPLGLNDAPLLLHQTNSPPGTFLQTARRFAPVHHLQVQDSVTQAVLPLLPLTKAVLIVIDERTSSSLDWVMKLTSVLENRRVVLIQFGNPIRRGEIPDHWTELRLDDRNRESECFAAQVVFGAQSVGAMPAVIPGFELPDTSQWSSEGLEQLEKRMNWALRRRTTPGAQLTVMHRGNIILEKSYGHHDYRRQQSVGNDDLYDLASVTKAASTSLAVMHLYDQAKIFLQGRVKDYLPELANSVAGNFQIDQLLTHQTGLQANLPAFDFIGRTFVSSLPSDQYSIQISPDRWLDNSIPTKIKDNLQRLDYTRRPIFKYSDVNYFLLQLVVERITGQSLDTYLEQHFYQPLGLHRLTFKPAERIPETQCVPSVYDAWMRETILRAYVHDEGAALLGGVAGHAGLFGNARDLARLFQLLLNEGRFGNQQILSPATVELFTTEYGYNYRALGFDRLMGGWSNLKDLGASESTFGHTGFSGTCVWADPDNDLVFVLLTNRIFPDPKRDRFKRYRVRSRVHGDVYRALASN